jgi:gem associated protein 5
MCQYYAKQLAADGDVRKAVSYFVAAAFHNEAFETLDEHQMYREAAALARSIYPANDERIVQSLSQWAVKAVGDYNFELAAKCYLAIGQVAEAARTLPRRGQPDSLRLAADLATHCQDDQLAAAYLIEATGKTAAAAVVPNGEVG